MLKELNIYSTRGRQGYRTGYQVGFKVRVYNPHNLSLGATGVKFDDQITR